jgi:uncharacterized protein (TIGR02145 family)
VIPLLECAGTIKDADSNSYQTVKIGKQIWTTENLRTTKLNDGSTILHNLDDSAWAQLNSSACCFYNNTGNIDSIQRFGALYNYYAVNSGKLSPPGWHIPTAQEWDTLITFLVLNKYNYDSTITDVKIAKSIAAKCDWNESSYKGEPGNEIRRNNITGFSAVPAGSRWGSGKFENIGRICYFWSSTVNTEGLYSDIFDLYYNNDGFPHRITEWKSSITVRLVKDEK